MSKSRNTCASLAWHAIAKKSAERGNAARAVHCLAVVCLPNHERGSEEAAVPIIPVATYTRC